MIRKPELFENICDYSGRVKYEYDNLTNRLDRLDIEILDMIIDCVYKEGLKDGLLLHAELDTN
mgnify:FL=1